MRPFRENKLELVERLADDLAHEIKNPLHSMVINLEVLRRRLARIDPPPEGDLVRYAEVLGVELEKVSERVDLLLRMVRPSTASDEPVPISEVLDELAGIIDLECQRKNIQFAIRSPELIPRPQLPRAETRQMLLSLLLEALDATAEEGKLTLVADSVEDQVEIRVSSSARRRDAVGDANSFLTVAQSIAARFGGTVDRDADSNGSAAQDRSATTYLLTLPHRG